LCREEAQELSSLKPQLDSLNVNLVGVVHETLGTEEFQSKFFAGKVYLDDERAFFNLLGNRWLGASGFVSPSVWMNIFRAKKKELKETWKEREDCSEVSW